MGLSVSSEVLSGIDPSDYDQFLLKIVIAGDYGVGKSSLVRRFAKNSFEETLSSTIGVEFWDTAGQERYRCITWAYFRGANGIILVYDVTKRSSFENIEDWVKQIENTCSSSDGFNRLLIGSKCDLQDEREVTYLEGKELADKIGYLFIETSSKDGRNVEQAFLALTSHIVNSQKQRCSEINPSDTIKLTEKTTNIKTRCCRMN